MSDLYLYHATDRKNLESILKNGLLVDPPEHAYEEFDCENKIFLAFDPDVAESYAEESDNPPDEIVLLKIKYSALHETAFEYDWNVRCEYADDISTCVYTLDIPPSCIQECKSANEPGQKLSDFRNTYLYEVLLDTFYYECETCKEEYD